MIKWLLTVLVAGSLLSDVAADTQVTTDSLRLTFDDKGQLKSAIACFPACSGETTRIQQYGNSGVIEFDALPAGRWERMEQRTETSYELTFTHATGASLSWQVPVRGYRLELKQTGLAGVTVSSGESFRPREAAGFGNWLEQSRYVIIHSGSTQQIGLDETGVEEQIADQWIGYRNRYWALMAGAPEEVTAQLIAQEGNQNAGLELNAGADWSFYLGPVEPRVLAAADPALDKLLYAGLWFWLRWICFALFHLLAGIQAVIPSWGLAVMVMSLSVNILMTPLSRIAERFQQEVNETEARLAPELSRIKKGFKGEEQSAKILALYKTERVHPLYSLKSLMGVAVVIPVFIGAFDMLAENIHLLNTGFLWISDLSRPDDLFRLPFTLPFFGNELNLLPFLMTGLSVVASSLHNPLALNAELRKKQVRNMLLLAVAFFVLFYTFPAGMVLYWTTNNLISVIKSLWARR